MILWDRIKKSLDNGFDQVMKVSKVVSERARIEAAVARLLIDKGRLETKEEKACRRLGERVFLLWEQKGQDVLKDPDVVEALREVTDIREEIETVRRNIRKASLGEEEL